MNAREFHVVLFGATGFTGGLVAEELAKQRDLRWAMAGRDLNKLEAVRARLASVTPDAADVPLLVADSHDAHALGELAASTRVVCSTVGPYAHHGSELVAACAANGTSYCDLTGEPQWIRRMIDAHHTAAEKSGARIVHCCGFDSIPSDLGTFVLAESLRRRGARLAEATLYVMAMRGGASGGTVASLLNVVDEARRDPETRKILLDPYGLCPEGERSGPDRRDSLRVERDHERDAWLGPFVMASINTRVVRRTNALLRYPYGREFRYREVMSFPPNARGWLLAHGFATGIAGLGALAALPTRPLLDRLLPKPGEGPDAAERERGSFRIEIAGREAPGGPITCVARIGADRDPGYGFTAVMLSQSALCLALDALDTMTGVLTPASAMGMQLIERLRAAGMTLAA